MNNNFSILIPARGGSKRIPKKNMIDINGKPLISYVLNQCKIITTSVYVSSDDNNILDFCIKHGVNSIMRPNRLSTDFTKTEEVLKHFLKVLTTNIDIVVIVQPTSPLLTAKHIKEGLKMMKNYDSIISVVEDTPFYWNQRGKPVNFELGDRARTQDRDIWYKENGAFYITKVKNFMKDCILQNGNVGFVKMNKRESIDIDNFDDLKLVRSIIKSEKL